MSAFPVERLPEAHPPELRR